MSWATFNHDGRLVLTVSGEVRSAGIPAAKSDRTTRVWEARTGKPLVTRAAGVAGFNPARNLVISPTERSDVVSVLEMASGRTIARLSGLTGQVTTTAFSRDGTLVAAAARDVGIWEVPSGRSVQVLRLAAEEVDDIALGPDGKTVVVASDKSATVWDEVLAQKVRSWSDTKDR